MITSDISRGTEASGCIFHVDAVLFLVLVHATLFLEPDGGHLEAKPKNNEVLYHAFRKQHLTLQCFQFVMKLSCEMWLDGVIVNVWDVVWDVVCMRCFWRKP